MSNILLKLTKSDYTFPIKMNEIDFNENIVRLKKFEKNIALCNHKNKAILMPISRSLISLKREKSFKNDDIQVNIHHLIQKNGMPDRIFKSN